MKFKKLFLVALLLASVLAPVYTLNSLPCYDRWRGCLAGGGGGDYCEGVWLGCMDQLYGYQP